MGKSREEKVRTLDPRDGAAPNALLAAALPARLAASAAERLASMALEETLDAIDGSLECAVRLDRLLTCAKALERVASAILAGAALDEATWRTVIEALCRMKQQCSAQLSADQFIHYLLLLDVMEGLLTEQPAQDVSVRRKKHGRRTRRNQESGTAAWTEAPIVAALALAGDDPLLAAHLLAGVAARTLGGTCSWPARRHGGRRRRA